MNFPSFTAALLALSLSPLSLAAAVSEPNPCADLTLTDAWVRVLPPTLGRTAAYLELSNSGGQACVVTAARSAIAGVVEIHQTIDVEGFKRMQAMAELVVPPKETVRLTPGGIHLMLLELTRMPEEGDSIDLCLATSAGEEICTTAVARRDSSGGGAEHHHH